MLVKEFKNSNLENLDKISSNLKEQFGYKVEVTSLKKLQENLKSIEENIVNIKANSTYFQRDPMYAKNIMLKSAYTNMLAEGMYFEGEVYEKCLEELKDHALGCMATGDDYDQAMDSARKSYEIMPVRYPADMIMFKLGEMVQEHIRNLQEGGAEEEVVSSEYTDAVDGKLPKYKHAYRKLGSSASGDDRSQAKAMVSILKSKGIDASVPDAMKFLKSLDEQKLAETLKLISEYIENNPEEFITEDVEVEEAEVIIAARALSDQIQDAVEDIGRAFNEDLPAIVDQMRGQLGIEKAQPFGENVGSALEGLLNQLKDAKEQVDSAIGGVTGTEPLISTDMEDPDAQIDPIGDMDDMGGDELDDFAGADANAGPVDDPLGRELK